MKIARRYFVSGRVQGVYFRASTRKEAQRLGVKGWAVNLPDGRVEVLAIGDSAAVLALEEWLYDGPPLAKVLAVDIAPADMAELGAQDDFNCG